MLATSQKLLHRARSLRRLHNHSNSHSSDDETLPQMPPSPTQISSPRLFSTSASVEPMTVPMTVSMPIPMPMPPTQRPRTGGIPIAEVDHPHDDHIHYRQVSTCSHASRASSSWSSNASTTSSTTSSRNAGLEWDSLRLHPVPCMPMPTPMPMPMPVVNASPQYYDAGRSFYYEDDADALAATTRGPHGFDFGFDASAARPSTASRRRAVRQTIADIHLASSAADDEGFEVQGLSAPPPRHHRLRAHQSEANLQHTMRDLQLLGDSGVLDRPSTPPMPALPTSEPASPVTPRTHTAESESERYFKRGDWKRRGIVFSAFDD
ncbi:hypothetical protein SPBR_06094 [Sporothrix brasiliensis 5110]|uniref:Uncharacterized protein n=1 Tax=Sporothrix brasiliensis 5110 TaxID=1398154 RepID=A0A0C2JCI9_9PEZI|nr:uncharacterized protein SPBR_06094 [Sporothrix brasiliensis 5110]KIH94622.1 hypothetical protein SPBR_06094 [Sporothrix brasiliensis 5110]